MMDDGEETAAVIMDCGSGFIKAGFAGDDAPRCIFPSIVGRAKNASAMLGADQKEVYIGDEAQAKRGVLILKYPIEHGIVVNWDDIEKVWSSCYSEQLKCSAEEHPILITEAVANPKASRERFCQIFFENFNTPAVYVCTCGVLAMYSAGRTTGLSCDMGHGMTSVLAIYEGYGQASTAKHVNFGGSDVTDYLMKILAENGYNFTTSAEREIVQDVKEKVCYVALDPDSETQEYASGSDKDKTYELPDGNIITVTSQRFRAPEISYSPELAGKEGMGAPKMVYAVINACAIDIRKDLFENIVVSGGNSMFTGVGERFTKEISGLAPATIKVQAHCPPERKYSVWIGGSILASLSTFQQQWISKGEYDESGPTVVHTKCPQT